jgi:acyl transferase domain-containing protein
MVEEFGAQLSRNPIAIIGMAGVFPEAKNLREYWNNILNKIDCIVDVPLSRWDIDDYYDPDPTAPDKTYCKRGGFIPDIDFDPLEFGLPPNILEVTDVSQLISLVIARDAMADAGYSDAADALRERTGVILGVGGGQKLFAPLTARLQYPVWQKVLRSSGIPEEDINIIIEKMKLAYVRWEENSFPGMLGNVIAGRIANRLDLGGTNSVVDAACASSLSALRFAVSELVEGKADMMISGGVDTDNSISMYMCFSKTPAFSRGDNPRPFDESSDGMMVGEGIGMLVLKRLRDAERDGDRIYAVIKGIGTSSDGRYKSIYAPRGEGQERALRRAYEDAGFSPSTVGMIEAHGTGTVAGDFTEVTTLVRYFNQHDSRKQHIALGSVKSQIGHTKATAGAAGLIKTALALHHKILPPMINIETPNPKFELETSPFYLSTEARPWFRQDEKTPRRAGVSSFGFGGTNFHVVMEEYAPEHDTVYRLHDVPQTVLLAADSPETLRALAEEVAAKLAGEDADTHYAQLVQSSNTVNIALNSARFGFVAATITEARELLTLAAEQLRSKPQADEWQHPRGVFYRKTGMDLAGRVVALFSGQGAQYPQMGKELALNFPALRDAYRVMDGLFNGDGLEPLSDAVFPPATVDAETQKAQTERLQRTDYAQPAIGVLSSAMYKLLQNAGFRPDFVAGHSFGELTALWAAGVLNDQDYYLLVKARGQAMAPLADPNFDAGTMLAVTGKVDNLDADLAQFPGVTIANYNSPSQVVLAGSKAAVAQAQQGLQAKGYNVVPLPVSAAFHTPLVGHAQQPFANAINGVTFKAPKTPVYSNATGDAYPADPSAVRTILAQHILQPVQFRREIENIYGAGGYLFVEFGPRNILTNLVKETLGSRSHVAISLNPSRQKDSDRQLREAVAQLRVIGLALTSTDPHQIMPAPAAKKRKGLTVQLSGNNYVSDKTRAAFQDALNDGYRLQLDAPTAPMSQPETIQNHVEPTAAPADSVAFPEINELHTETTFEPEPVAHVVEMSTPPSMNTLEQTLAQFATHQNETLHVHEQYLANQTEYLKIFFQLMQQHQTLLASQTLAVDVASNLAKSMMLFQDHQSETLRVHQQYLASQSQMMDTLLQMVREQYATLAKGTGVSNGAAHFVSAPVVSKPSTNGTQPALKPAQTAAPVFAPPVAQRPAPGVSAPVSQTAAPTPTPAPVTPAPVVEPQPVASAPIAAPAPQTASADDPQFAILSSALLAIVSEKTGYPAEMLELEMDVEADLGIDSIKRVEILGAMRDQFPELPQLKPEELAELRTLAQIADYMRVNGSSAPTSTVPVATPAAQSSAIQQPTVVIQSAPVVTAPAPSAHAPVATVTESGPDASVLSSALLAIVSEKTGYPAEMLELEMDVEADLGIDSIKRVEILGAMRDQFPELPQLKPEELAELRTLAQIVNYMRAHTPAAAATAPAPDTAPATPVANPPLTAESVPSASSPASPVAEPQPQPIVSNSPDASVLSSALLAIVSEKTGYPAEMLELEMDVEADLGIDSIKRVEILGAMRDQFPELPQLKPEELAELRTLAQIVDYMKENTAVAPVPEAPAQAAPQMNGGAHNGNGKHNHDIPRSGVRIKALPASDTLDFALPQGYVALLTDDGTAVTANVAQTLAQRDWKVVVLSFPRAVVPTQAQLPANVNRVVLADSSEASLKAALDSIAAQYGPVGAFVHVGPTARSLSHNGILFLDQEKAIVKHVFLIAKYLKVSLNQAAQLGRACFITVSRLDGVFGTSDHADFGAIGGGLFGLAKTLNLEWEAVYCRAVDLDVDLSPDKAARFIVAEIDDPNRMLTEVAYGPQGRVTIVAEQAHLNGAAR